MSREDTKDVYVSAVTRWWKDLHSDRRRAERAELRRCADVHQVVMALGYHRLRQKLIEELGELPVSAETLAATALTLTHVKTAYEGKAARSSSEKKRGQRPSLAALFAGLGGEPGRAPVSERRFQKLLRLEQRAELAPALRRTLPLIHHRAHLPSLLEDLRYWGPKTRQRWAEDYYDVSSDFD